MIYDQTKKGENNHGTKVLDDEVADIRKMHATGKYLQRELAEIFGLTQGHISYIVCRKSRI